MSDHPRVLLHPGAKLDRYQLLCPLADGGMAAVWLGRVRAARGFERLVAIKTIKPQLREDERLEQMFLDEARIASRIHHPNVAQILDLGEASELLFLVMEYVDGESLSRTRRISERAGVKMALDVVLRIVADVCAGLHAAHELRGEDGAPLGVVHRDVSPQNVLVTPQGEVKLIDFGIARAHDRSSAETTAGSFKGKVPYMAPEQITGRDYDRRVDLWAVGVMLYELLAGVRPFAASDDLGVFKRITSGEPPPPLPAAVPKNVVDIVDRALEYRPEDRFATAAEMRDDIERALAELHLRGTNVDVAAFVQQNLAVQTTQRRALVRTAIETTNQLDAILDASAANVDVDVDADDNAPTRVHAGSDDAPTLVRSDFDDAPTRVRGNFGDALTRKAEGRRAPAPERGPDEDIKVRTSESTLTQTHVETARRHLPRRGGYRAFIGVALVGIVLAIGWQWLGRTEPIGGATSSRLEPVVLSTAAASAPSPTTISTPTAPTHSATPSAAGSVSALTPTVSSSTAKPSPKPKSAKPAHTYDHDGI